MQILGNRATAVPGYLMPLMLCCFPTLPRLWDIIFRERKEERENRRTNPGKLTKEKAGYMGQKRLRYSMLPLCQSAIVRLALLKNKKEVYRGWKQGQVTWEEYRDIV